MRSWPRSWPRYPTCPEGHGDAGKCARLVDAGRSTKPDAVCPTAETPRVAQVGSLVGSTPQVSTNGLLVFEARVANLNTPWRVLIDTGASENFARRQTVRSNEQSLGKSAFTSRGHELFVRLADGTMSKSDGSDVELRLRFQDFDCKVQFVVLEMDDRYDLILGMPWLVTHKPWIDWSERLVWSCSPAGLPAEEGLLREFNGIQSPPLKGYSDEYHTPAHKKRVGSPSDHSRDRDVESSPSSHAGDVDVEVADRADHSGLMGSALLPERREKHPNALLGDGSRSRLSPSGIALREQDETHQGGLVGDGSRDRLSPSGIAPQEQDETHQGGLVGDGSRSRLSPSGITPQEQDETHSGGLVEDGSRNRLSSKGIAPLEQGKDHNDDLARDGSRHRLSLSDTARSRLRQSLRSTIASLRSKRDGLHRAKVKRVNFQLGNDSEESVVGPRTLPTTTQGVTQLPELGYAEFLRELHDGEIEEIAVPTVATVVDLNFSSNADETVLRDEEQPRLDSQAWLAVKDSPFYDVLLEFADIFPEKVPQGLPPDKGIRHEVDLVPGTKYVTTKQWPLPKEMVDEIDRVFAERLAAGHVRESKSPHSSPTFCVKKASGGWRIVHAFNKLNAATIPAQTPLPRKDVLIDSMSGSTIFSAIDLMDGFYQILMRESDFPLTAVSTPSGMLWEWLVMPQGLRNAPATFNRLVTQVMRRHRAYAPSYFDDIFIHSRAEDGLSEIEVHRKHLRAVF